MLWNVLVLPSDSLGALYPAECCRPVCSREGPEIGLKEAKMPHSRGLPVWSMEIVHSLPVPSFSLQTQVYASDLVCSPM